MENKMEATIMGLYRAVVKILPPFLGTLNIRGRIIIGDPKRNHNFDNHPYRAWGLGYQSKVKKVSG